MASVAVPSDGVLPGVRGLVIGQAPPDSPERLPDGYQPLQGQPEKRLARLAGFASPDVLWTVFDRIDLIGWCPGPKDRKEYHFWHRGYRKHRCDGHRFPMRDARLAASRLKRFGSLARRYSVVVLCGRHVASAFSLKLRCVPWTEEVDGVRYLVMPHPSGVSHFWNDEVSWHRAAGAFRATLRAVQLLPPPLGSPRPGAAEQGEMPMPGAAGGGDADKSVVLSSQSLDVPSEDGTQAPPQNVHPVVVRSRFFHGGAAAAATAAGSGPLAPGGGGGQGEMPASPHLHGQNCCDGAWPKRLRRLQVGRSEEPGVSLPLCIKLEP